METIVNGEAKERMKWEKVQLEVGVVRLVRTMCRRKQSGYSSMMRPVDGGQAGGKVKVLQARKAMLWCSWNRNLRRVSLATALTFLAQRNDTATDSAPWADDGCVRWC